MSLNLYSGLNPGRMGRQLESGFTLVEMVFTFAILAILVLISVGPLRAVRERAKQTQCLSNLRQIGLVLQTWADQHQGRFLLALDGGKTWDEVLTEEGLLDPKSFSCPSDLVERTVAGEKRSYAINGYIADVATDEMETLEGYASRSTMPSHEVVLVADRGGAVSVIGAPTGYSSHGNADCLDNHKVGSNYVFLDLHAEWLDDSTGRWNCVPSAAGSQDD